MGPSLSNILVKYVRKHSGDICPIYDLLVILWLIYEPYFAHGPSNLLAILKIFTREKKVPNFYLVDENSAPAPGVRDVITKNTKKRRKRYSILKTQNGAFLFKEFFKSL